MARVDRRDGCADALRGPSDDRDFSFGSIHDDSGEAEDSGDDEGSPQGPILPVGGFGSPHPGGSLFSFGDGHVEFLSGTIAAGVYQQLGHRADGKLLDANDY